MFAQLSNWLDHRTGCRKLIDALLLEHIPGGAKWRYVWGSCLAFVFGVQLITGVLLMTAYSPGDSTAWSSVYFIQYQMDFGWLIRGLHHFGSQAMVVLLGLHMLQVVIAGAQLPPREINWWLGLALMGAVLGLSLTGYLLPWDQKGYYATRVATNIASTIPFVGSWLQRVIVGGPEYGHHTLTRFYALHVGILPLLIIVLLIAHIVVFRRHGITTPKDAKGEGLFWPDQAFRDMLASMVIFGILLTLVVVGHGHKIEAPAGDSVGERSLWDKWAHAGRDGRGANLDAPADQQTESYPARPEWYFLSLFQLLKSFESNPFSSNPLDHDPVAFKLFGEDVTWIFIGAAVVPGIVGLLLFLLPLLGYGRLRPLGHIIGVVVVVGLLVGVGALTLLAIGADTSYPLTQAVIAKVALNIVPLIALVLLLLLGILALLRRGTFRAIVCLTGTLAILVLSAAGAFVTYQALEADKKFVAYARSDSQEAFEDSQIPRPIAEWAEKGMKEEDKEDKAFLKKPVGQMNKEDKEKLKKLLDFQNELDQANRLGKRAVTLAWDQKANRSNIPDQGAVFLLRRDPQTQGKKLFKNNCASCHNYGDEFKSDKATASDLAGFGTEPWILRLLTNPGHDDFFGRTKLRAMDKAIKENFVHVHLAPGQEGKLSDEEKKILEEDRADLKVLARWLSSHPRNNSKDKDQEWFKSGVELFRSRLCVTCHTYEGEGGKQGPDLTGYGDAEWLRLMIMAPNHPSRYGENNAMPAFRDLLGLTGEVNKLELSRIKEFFLSQLGDEEPKTTKQKKELERKKKQIEEATQSAHLSDIDRELILRWLLNDDRIVFGGTPLVDPRRLQGEREER